MPSEAVTACAASMPAGSLQRMELSLIHEPDSHAVWPSLTARDGDTLPNPLPNRVKVDEPVEGPLVTSKLLRKGDVYVKADVRVEPMTPKLATALRESNRPADILQTMAESEFQTADSHDVPPTRTRAE